MYLQCSGNKVAPATPENGLDVGAFRGSRRFFLLMIAFWWSLGTLFIFCRGGSTKATSKPASRATRDTKNKAFTSRAWASAKKKQQTNKQTNKKRKRTSSDHRPTYAICSAAWIRWPIRLEISCDKPSQAQRTLISKAWMNAFHVGIALS